MWHRHYPKTAFAFLYASSCIFSADQFLPAYSLAQDLLLLIPLAAITLAFAAVAWLVYRHGGKIAVSGQDDFANPDTIALRARGASRLMKDLLPHDDIWNEKSMRLHAKDTYSRLFHSISSQDSGSLRRLLRADLFKQYRDEIQSQIDSGSHEAIEHLVVERVEIVRLCAFKAKEQDEFTAWVRSRASRYTVSGSGYRPTRDETAPRHFEHFLSFQRDGDGWMLCRVEEYGAAQHLLRTDSICELVTPPSPPERKPLRAKKGGSVGRDEILRRAGKAEAVLAHLSKSEGHWSEPELIELAKSAYDAYYACLSARDFRPINYLMAPEFYGHASKLASEMRAAGIRIEARNLCVRDVEIVLVKNRCGTKNDEFTAWVQAHAQIVQLNQKGEVIGGDESARVFEEYLTFVHSDGWLLEEMIPPEKGEYVLSEPDSDDEGEPTWTNWYFRLLPPDKDGGNQA